MKWIFYHETLGHMIRECWKSSCDKSTSWKLCLSSSEAKWLHLKSFLNTFVVFLKEGNLFLFIAQLLVLDNGTFAVKADLGFGQEERVRHQRCNSESDSRIHLCSLNCIPQNVYVEGRNRQPVSFRLWRLTSEWNDTNSHCMGPGMRTRTRPWPESMGIAALFTKKPASRFTAVPLVCLV